MLVSCMCETFCQVCVNCQFYNNEALLAPEKVVQCISVC